MQKSRGSEMSDNAAWSFCFARTCGGITGMIGGWARVFSQRLRANAAIARSSAMPSVHHSHAQVFGISTGGLIARMSLVTLVDEGGVGGGTSRAELLELILGSAMQPPLLACLKKPAQFSCVRLAGLELDGIDARGAEQAEQISLGLRLPLGEGRAFSSVVRVDF